MQKPYQNYKPVDFLKDERFIKWQLFPDEEDHLYWNSFIKKYPEQNEVINEAISLMKGMLILIQTQKKKKYGGTLTTKSQNVPPLNAGVMQLLLQHVS